MEVTSAYVTPLCFSVTQSSFTTSEEEEQNDEIDDELKELHIGDEDVEDTLEHDDETLELQQLVVESDELDVILSFSGLTAVIIAYV